MIADGIEPDVVTLTTLIDAYNRVNNIDKCWEIFQECRTFRLNGKDADELMLSYMIRVASKTHEAEKALRIYQDLEADGFMEQDEIRIFRPFKNVPTSLDRGKSRIYTFF